MDAKLKYPVITINRQYCAYGRTVAAALEKHLGIRYYDRDFVEKTAAESGFSENTVREESENISSLSNFIDNMLNVTASYNSSYDRIYEAQRQVVLKLAQEPCILVGRCANHILREKSIDSFDVFLYADTDCRLRRAAELNPDTDAAHLEKQLKKEDSERETYYRKYAGMEFNDPANYDICLNVGSLGTEKVIEIILSLVTE